MNRSEQEKFELIFDHLTGQVDHSQEVEALIASDERAKSLYIGLRNTFSHLDCLCDVEPPIGLIDRTVEFVRVHREVSKNDHLTLINSSEFGHESRISWVFGNLRDLIAVAACLAMVLLVGKPSLDYSRSLYRQLQCQDQIAEVGSAFQNYADDNNGNLPQVAQTSEAKWWNIGEQNPDSGSNTKNIYKLVRDGYIQPDRFICPSEQNSDIYTQVSTMTPSQVKSYQDFLSRKHVNYSFKLIVPGVNQKLGIRREALAADKNPIFAEFDSNLQNVVSVPVDSRLRTINSHNHNRGQVVLFSDGSVIFLKDRYYGPQKDDIFTINKAIEYFGTERPAENDTFIAP